MSLAGTGVVAIWHDLLPEAKSDFYEWHNREHMPERVGIPGFQRGRRYIVQSGAPEFFNLYEAETPEVLGGRDYLDRLNSPTAWTKRVVPSFRNVARSICRVAYSSGVGSGGVMATMHFDVDPGDCATMIDALTMRLLPPLALGAGITGAHLCLADEAVSSVETAEKRARADTTRVPTWIVLIEGIGPDEVRSATTALAPALTQYRARAVETAVYRHEYTRLKTPQSAG